MITGKINLLRYTTILQHRKITKYSFEPTLSIFVDMGQLKTRANRNDYNVKDFIVVFKQFDKMNTQNFANQKSNNGSVLDVMVGVNTNKINDNIGDNGVKDKIFTCIK